MLVPQYDALAFGEDTVKTWGHLSEYLTEDKNDLHLQIGNLGKLCINHPHEAESILQFLEEAMARPDAVSEIENAVAISFLDWSELSALVPAANLPLHLTQVIRNQWERA